MLLHFSAQIAGRLKVFSVVLSIPKTRQLLKKDCMCPWLLSPSLFLKQMCSVHHVANSLWSCQRSLMKMSALVVRVVCLQLVEKELFSSWRCLVTDGYLAFACALSLASPLWTFLALALWLLQREFLFSLSLRNSCCAVWMMYWHYFALRSANALGEMKKRSHEGKTC